MESTWSEHGVKMEPTTNEQLVNKRVEIFTFFENSYEVSKRVFNDFTNGTGSAEMSVLADVWVFGSPLSSCSSKGLLGNWLHCFYNI